jgi:glycosyltransferase involved in cell wall biosynthesis
VQREETGRRSDQPILPTRFARMKITIATGPIYPVPTVLGGSVQRIWHGLAREFVKRGHEVTIFAKAHEGQPAEEIIEGIRFVRWGGYDLSTSIRTDLFRCLVYAVRAARRVPKGDVVVANDFWTPAVLPLLNPAAGPVVASIARFPKRQFGLYGKCRAVVAVSEVVAEAIRQQTPRISSRVHVVPNNVDSAFLETPTAAKTVDTAGRVRILFAGRLHPEKGLELLLSALRLMAESSGKVGRWEGGKVGEVKSWECEIIGPVSEAEGGGGEEYVSRLRRMAEGLPVVFTPPVYGARELAGVYDKAEIFVYPSLAERGESFGLAPLEAMARGLVPVVSALSVFGEYLRDGNNGVAFNHRGSGKEENLARALTALVNDPETRHRMAASSRETAGHFSPVAVAGKYLDLFERITR